MTQPDAPTPSPADLDDPRVAGIEEAAAAGDWTTALARFRADTVPLLVDRWPWACRLMARVPAGQDMDPVLRLVHGFLVGRPGAALPAGVDDDGLTPKVRLVAALIHVITLRSLGRLDEAEQVVLAVRPVVEAAGSQIDVEVGMVRLHFGILRLLRGELDAATEELQVAHMIGRHARSEQLVRHASGTLALIHALRGDLGVAEDWLEIFDGADVDPTGHYERRVRVAGVVAGALVALGRLRVEEASAWLDRLENMATTEELWAFVAYARGVLALSQGDGVRGLAVLDAAEAAHPGATTAAGVSTPLLAALRVDLLLAAGQGVRALAVLAAHRGARDGLSLQRARAALLVGDLAEAVPAADAVAWGSTAPLWPRVSAFVTAAVARWRRAADGGPQADEDRAAAHAALLQAVELAAPVGLRHPFALAPRQELLEIAVGPGGDRVRQVLDDPVLVSVGSLLPTTVAFVDLSERELAVLAELATTRSFEVVAKRLFVSTNTVKTQARQVYRKLGVHSREEALSEAHRLGLLGP